MIIVIEGCDASGKKTQSELLAERLKGTRFAFPNYESETGKAILGHLKKEWTAAADRAPKPDRRLMQFFANDAPLNALVFQSLMTVNRIERLPAIREAQARGPVIFDRYFQSAVVYGTLDGLDPDWLRVVQELPMPKADVNILIDVPIEEGFKRRPERRDRYETDRPFLEKVRQGYLQMWGPHTGKLLIEAEADLWASVETKPGWYIVNGLGTIEEVHKFICTVLRDHLSLGQNCEQRLSQNWNINDAKWTPALGWNGELDRRWPEDGDK